MTARRAARKTKRDSLSPQVPQAQQPRSAASPQQPRPRTLPLLLMCAALAIVTFVTFWGVLSNEFVSLDDPVYVSDNAHVLAGVSWDNVKWAFTTNYFGYYYPLTWLSHMLDVQLFSLDAGRHHLTSLILHVLNTLLLFLALHRMTRAFWRSSLVAWLFAIHPLHVESVAWIAERKDVLSTFFWFLCLLAYALYAERPSVGKLVPVFAFFLLGMMAKPMLITLPFTLLLLDFWPLGRWPSAAHPSGLAPAGKGPGQPASLGQLLIEKAPLFALVPVFAVVTFVSQKQSNAVVSVESIPLAQRAANALISYCAYVAKMFTPVRLAVFYPHPLANVSYGLAALCGLAIVAATAAALWFGRKRKYLAFGWLWYVGTLVPVIGIVQVGSQAMADRYTYVPLVGLFVAATWSVGELVGRTSVARYLAAGTTTAALVGLCSLAYVQVGYWAGSEVLFEHALAVVPNNHLAQNNLGVCLFEKGEREQAIAHYREAIRIDPGYAQAHINLGVALFRVGKWEEALATYSDALRLKPDDAGVCAGMATVLALLSRSAEANEYLQKALDSRADTFDAHYSLAIALMCAGRLPEAKEHCDRALEMKPTSPLALTGMGQILGRMERLPEAVEYFHRALQADPKNLDALLNLGVALQHQGHTQEALEYLQKALLTDPDSPAALKTMGTALATLNRLPEAIEYLQRAAAASPRDAETQYALGQALALERRFPEARDHFREAARLRPDDADARSNLQWVQGILDHPPPGAGAGPGQRK